VSGEYIRIYRNVFNAPIENIQTDEANAAFLYDLNNTAESRKSIILVPIKNTKFIPSPYHFE
jgi:hypothetical protein